VDSGGNLWISDTDNRRIRHVDARGIITTIAGGADSPTSGSGDGRPALGAYLSWARGIGLDAAGNLYLIDGPRLRKVDGGTGIISTVAGNGFPEDGLGDDGPALDSRFTFPSRVAASVDGDLFVVDSSAARIRRIDGVTQIINTIVGDGGLLFGGDGGPGAEGAVQYPLGLAMNPQGDLFIADHSNRRVRRIDRATGMIQTVAGGGSCFHNCSYDNVPATSLVLPEIIDLAYSADDNLYLLTPYAILRVELETGILHSVQVQLPIPPIFGTPGTRGNLISPTGLAVDATGNLYVSELGPYITEIDGHRVWRIDSQTGTGQAVGGGASGNFLYIPSGLQVDSRGNLYILDSSRILRLDAMTGTMTVAAGGGSAPARGAVEVPATSVSLALTSVDYPAIYNGLGKDTADRLYFAEPSAGYIYRLDTSTGLLTMVAGGGVGRDGAPPLQARFLNPRDIVPDALGNIFISETGDHRIRAIGYANQAPTALAQGAGEFPCDSPRGTWVELDGRGSTDPDSTPGTQDDIRNLEWFAQYGLLTERRIATGSNPRIELPIGTHRITLVATDRFGASSSDTLDLTVTDIGGSDQDGDGISDSCDTCPCHSDREQADLDRDGVGDVCDSCTDFDGDGFGSSASGVNACSLDNCAYLYNPDQSDSDLDGRGDRCDPCAGDVDPDADSVCTRLDNCLDVPNPGQDDNDRDGVGDTCDSCTDPDRDGFGTPGCPANSCPDDNCPSHYNPGQENEDQDAFGDVCDLGEPPVITEVTRVRSRRDFTCVRRTDLCVVCIVDFLDSEESSVDRVRVTARVTDPNAIDDVTKVILRFEDPPPGRQSYQPYPIEMEMYDSGPVPIGSIHTGSMIVPIFSGDETAGDGIYTREFYFQTTLLTGSGWPCAEEEDFRQQGFTYHRYATSLYYPPSESLDFPISVRAVDRKLNQSDSPEGAVPIQGTFRSSTHLSSPCGPPIPGTPGCEPGNFPPEAAAGTDAVQPCNVPGGAHILLDGSGSIDPDSTPESDDITRYDWIEGQGSESERLLGTGRIFSAFLGVGEHFVLLRVTDSWGHTSEDEVLVTVLDPLASDTDGDEIGDTCDVCPEVSNESQADADGDHAGDACDVCTDLDGDGFGNAGYSSNTCPLDNCEEVRNPGQEDSDGDSVGDACDPCPIDALDDADGDGICADRDTCPDDSNPGQEDADRDGQGDFCDSCTDTDGDGHGDPGFPATTCSPDNCPSDANPLQDDLDGDGIGDACDGCSTDPQNDGDHDGLCADVDNCPLHSNPDQIDIDSDGSGDACDPCSDRDGDGFGDPKSPVNTCPRDNCGDDFNPDQENQDGDTFGDICDFCPLDVGNDADSDLLCENIDNCDFVGNPDQTDVDGDGIGEACDPCLDDPGNDPDEDGVCAALDNCPHAPNAGQSDADRDGLGDPCDPCTDPDGDGFGSEGYPGNTCPPDNCVAVANPDQEDSDSDSVGEPCDPCPLDPLNDADADGACADGDNCPGEPNPGQQDADGDGEGDACDACTDTDGDGLGNPGFPATICARDNCPTLANPFQEDFDADGQGNICDLCPLDAANDADFDLVCGNLDNCATVYNPDQGETDGDSLGNACDPCTDQDDDGWGDPGFAASTCATDNCPAESNPLQEDSNGDGSGDACQPALSVSPVRTVGPELLAVSVTASDPQNDLLRGSLEVFRSGTDEIILADAFFGGGCGSGYHPDRVQGQGIGFLFGSLADPLLFDLDVVYTCDDGLPDFEIALGPCAEPAGEFQSVLSLLGQPSSFPACIRRTGAGAATYDLFVHSYDLETLQGTVSGPDARALAFHFEGSPPRTIALSSLESDKLHSLVFTMTVGNTVPVTASAEFVHRRESRIALNHPPMASLSLPDSVECEEVSGGRVRLDATGSSDADSPPGTREDIVEYLWYLDFGSEMQQGIGTGETVDALIRLGSQTITLLVRDSVGETTQASATTRVVDTTPPLLTCPADIVAECVSSQGAPVSLAATSQDACGAAQVVNDRTDTGSDASGIFALGSTRVAFRSSDTSGNVATCESLVTVRDTVPPRLELGLSPVALWPPNHHLVDVRVHASATDTCGDATAVLDSIGSSEPDDAPGLGDGNTRFDIQDAEVGTGDLTFRLRAERDGTGAGRTYTVAYSATDGSGNTTTAGAFAIVPHDVDGLSDPVVLSVHQEGIHTRVAWSPVPGAQRYSLVRGWLANIRPATETTDLGPVTCVELLAGDAEFPSGGDDSQPGLGEGLFYLVSFENGSWSSYGAPTAAVLRAPTSGDCVLTAAGGVISAESSTPEVRSPVQTD
jgi:hypothetical protein